MLYIAELYLGRRIFTFSSRLIWIYFIFRTTPFLIVRIGRKVCKRFGIYIIISETSLIIDNARTYSLLIVNCMNYFYFIFVKVSSYI